MIPPSIQNLIEQFSKFPTIGPRTAGRFVFYLLKQPPKKVEELIESLKKLQSIKHCQFCHLPFEDSKESLCGICLDKRRNKEMLCIIEKESDLFAIEKTKKYHGLYFILNNTAFPPIKENIEKIQIQDLLKKIKNANIKEVILAINPTAKSEATALYLERAIKPLNIKITRLGRGLPTGGELEYADEETLSSALEGRK